MNFTKDQKRNILVVFLLVLLAVALTLAVVNPKIRNLEKEVVFDREILTDLFHRVDYREEPVIVIGHKNPDFDTTASAIGMAYLLNQLGIEAEARIAGPLNLETEYGLSVIGYPAPEILENAADRQLWLVDHSEYQLMVDGAEEARIVGITDHHGIGDAETSELINVLSCPAGSTAAVVYTLCEKCGVDLPQDVAGVLLAGILSDTANMKGNGVTALDEAAFEKLREISGISDTDALYNGMLEARLSYKGMDDRDIYYSDYKEYETNGFLYGIGNIKVAHPEQVPEMAERMLRVIESEAKNGSEMQFLLFQVYDPDYSLGYMGFTGNDAALTEKLMDTAFGSVGQKQGTFYVFSPSLQRKTEVVPPIDDCLNDFTP